MTYDFWKARDAAADDADRREQPCGPCAEGFHRWCDGGDCDCPCFTDPIDNGELSG